MISFDLGTMFRTRWTWFSLPSDVPGVAQAAFLSYGQADVPGFRRKEGLTTRINLLLSEEDLWNGMRERFIRKQIVRGEAAGIRVREGTMPEFLPLYRSLRKAKGMPRNPVKALAGTARILIAESEGRPLAGGLFLGDGENVRAYALASIRFDAESGRGREFIGYASRMLLWEAMRMFKREGYRHLDLGGIDPLSANPAERSLAEFKEAFGGVRVPCYFYRKTYSPALRSLRRARALLHL